MAVTLQDIHVTGISPEVETTELGTSRDMTHIFYNIGDFGPYSVVIPKLELSAQRVLTEIRQDAQKYIDVLNLTF